jgi:hypothetical protein
LYTCKWLILSLEAWVILAIFGRILFWYIKTSLTSLARPT